MDYKQKARWVNCHSCGFTWPRRQQTPKWRERVKSRFTNMEKWDGRREEWGSVNRKRRKIRFTLRRKIRSNCEADERRRNRDALTHRYVSPEFGHVVVVGSEELGEPADGPFAAFVHRFVSLKVFIVFVDRVVGQVHVELVLKERANKQKDKCIYLMQQNLCKMNVCEAYNAFTMLDCCISDDIFDHFLSFW